MEWACEACGIPLAQAHSAAGDAMATAHLLRHLLENALCRGVRSAGEFLRELPVPASWRIDGRWLPRRAAVVRARAKAQAEQATFSFIPSLLSRLPLPTEAEDLVEPGADLYLDLLDRVLADRIIDAQERRTINEAVDQWGLSYAAVTGAHHSYMRRLVRQAWADGVITPAERRDLLTVSQLLAIPESVLHDMLQAERGVPSEGAGAIVGIKGPLVELRGLRDGRIGLS